MPQSFSNKVFIITGASSGIGKALCLELASRGAIVVMAARRMEEMEEIIKEWKDGVGEGNGKELSHFLPVRTDVTMEEDCSSLIRTTVEHFGRIDGLICNAGISMRALFEEVSLDVLRQVMEVNFWGTVYCTKYALPWLLKSRGNLTGISSVAGFKGLPGRTGYSASKFAMQGFLETVRIENMKKGLHVLIACPGFTASNIRKVALNKDGNSQAESPLEESRLMPAQEVAAAIVKAIAGRKRSLILTSQGKMTYFLNKLFPGWMDSMVYKHMAKEPDSPF